MVDPLNGLFRLPGVQRPPSSDHGFLPAIIVDKPHAQRVDSQSLTDPEIHESLRFGDRLGLMREGASNT